MQFSVPTEGRIEDYFANTKKTIDGGSTSCGVWDLSLDSFTANHMPSQVFENEKNPLKNAKVNI